MNQSIPDFLTRPNPPTGGGRLSHSFIEAGLRRITHSVRAALIQWELASARGVLQRMDARIKLPAILFLLIVASVKREIVPLMVLISAAFIMAAISRIGLGPYTRRVLGFGLFFGLLIALPSTLNLIVPGTVIYPIFSLDSGHRFLIYEIPQVIGITAQGLAGAEILTLRVLSSCALSFLLISTTTFAALVRALKFYRAPDAFVMTLALAYKHIFIFSRIAGGMHLALRARLAGATSASGARDWAAGRIWSLFKRTAQSGDELVKAMLARGFDGTVRLYRGRSLTASDYIGGACIAAVGLVTLMI